MVDFSPEEEQSQFNQGIATIQRIHSAILELDVAIFTNDFVTQYQALKVLFQEVRPMLNDTERTNLKKLKDAADNKAKTVIEEIKNKKILHGTVIEFDELENELRDMIQKHNLGLPKKQDARYALANK